MIAIAESGSTKTEWFVINEHGDTVSRFYTQGFNPDFHGSRDISEALSASKEIEKIGKEICKVYFFGASCSSKNNISKVKAGLITVFPNSTIFVDHDLLACAYALSDGEELITCILGTGSNSAYYDGQSMIAEIPALGVFMGDEASGAYFGKRLLKDFFNQKLPTDIHHQLGKEHSLKWSETREIIYGSNQANVFLASFMPFIFQFQDHAYIKDIVKEGIEDFIDIHVNCYRKYSSKRVGFVGTIAFLFQDQLRDSLQSQGFELAKVIKSPGQELVNHLIQVRKILEKSPESARVE